MKTLKPLATAFLLLASSASAQLLSGPSGGGFSMTSGNGGNSNPFSLAGSGSGGTIPDASFTCSSMENVHIPFASCTETQLADRRRFNGECPPQSTACREYLQRALSGANPAGTIAAYTPPPGREWASPDCQRIPCRLADVPGTTPSPRPAPGAGAVDSGLPYDQQPGFIGPPAPPSAPTLPAPFSPADFQREIADARAGTQLPVVDLGENRYGVVHDDGTVSVCGRAGCRPRPASEFPNLADKIQEATSLNNGDSINKENPGGFTPASNKQRQTPPGASDRSGGDDDSPPPVVASNPRDEAQASGDAAGKFFNSNGGGMGASAGGTSGNGYAAAAAGGKEEPIAAEAAELDGVFTYIKTQQIKATIDRTAGAVTSGDNGTFVTPNTAPDANAGDLQFKGTQSGANR